MFDKHVSCCRKHASSNTTLVESQALVFADLLAKCVTFYGADQHAGQRICVTGAEKALHIPVLSVKNPYAALFYHFCKSFEARTKAMLQSLEGRYMLLHVSQPCRGDEK
jgi:hypothetical protein